jgi:molybdenum cofactor cytidylyltransferase
VSAEGGIAAVLLAAGASRRFGEENKLLAHIDGRTLLERIVNALAIAGIADIVVVTGHDRAAVEEALRSRPVRFVHNGRWESGMGSSIAAGVAGLDAHAVGCFIVPGDVGLLPPRLVSDLVTAFEQREHDCIVYPTTATGEQRNPVLWPRRHFGALLALPPDKGAKALLQLVASECVAVAADDAAISDIDTPADLAAARKLAGD